MEEQCPPTIFDGAKNILDNYLANKINNSPDGRLNKIYNNR